MDLNTFVLRSCGGKIKQDDLCLNKSNVCRGCRHVVICSYPVNLVDANKGGSDCLHMVSKILLTLLEDTYYLFILESVATGMCAEISSSQLNGDLQRWLSMTALSCSKGGRNVSVGYNEKQTQSSSVRAQQQTISNNDHRTSMTDHKTVEVKLFYRSKYLLRR